MEVTCISFTRTWCVCVFFFVSANNFSVSKKCFDLFTPQKMRIFRLTVNVIGNVFLDPQQFYVKKKKKN